MVDQRLVEWVTSDSVSHPQSARRLLPHVIAARLLALLRSPYTWASGSIARRDDQVGSGTTDFDACIDIDFLESEGADAPDVGDYLDIYADLRGNGERRREFPPARLLPSGHKKMLRDFGWERQWRPAGMGGGRLRWCLQPQGGASVDLLEFAETLVATFIGLFDMAPDDIEFVMHYEAGEWSRLLPILAVDDRIALDLEDDDIYADSDRIARLAEELGYQGDVTRLLRNPGPAFADAGLVAHTFKVRLGWAVNHSQPIIGVRYHLLPVSDRTSVGPLEFRLMFWSEEELVGSQSFFVSEPVTLDGVECFVDDRTPGLLDVEFDKPLTAIDLIYIGST